MNGKGCHEVLGGVRYGDDCFEAEDVDGAKDKNGEDIEESISVLVITLCWNSFVEMVEVSVRIMVELL